MAKKYIDAEKLIAEIERLKQTSTPFCSEEEQSWDNGYNEALDDILHTINSLPEGGTENQEKVYQPSEDCDKPNGYKLSENSGQLNSEDLDVFKAGARWQKAQDIKLIQRTKDSWYKEGFVKGQIEGLSEDEKYQQGRFDEREQMMIRAIKWIEYNNENGGCYFDGWQKDFKKAMEDKK